MAFPAQRNTGNILLRSMTSEDFALLEPHLERVPLQVGQVVAEINTPIDMIYFPEGGVVSFSDVLSGGERIGIGILGCEGVTGCAVLLGCRTSPHEASVAVADGDAVRISTAALLQACERSESLRVLLLRFVQTFTIQLGRTIVSNLVDPVERRLSRWLLMNHDRLGGDEIELTHQQIGIMLGVRRASVTDALHLLEGESVIRCRRGRVTIRDRERLQQIAGEAYGFAEAEYCRLIGSFGKNGRAPQPQVGA
jgi:CRP-like cAMP-binding protein